MKITFYKPKKLYRVIDLEGGNFMDWTDKEPMTLNDLRKHFWALEEARATKYKYFTSDYIQEMWFVRFEEV